MGENDTAPVVADTRTGAVSADLSEDDGAPIARPARWVASVLWFIPVLTLAIIALGTAAAAILNFISPTNPPTSSGEMVAMSGGAIGSLLALFTARPGTR